MNKINTPPFTELEKVHEQYLKTETTSNKQEKNKKKSTTKDNTDFNYKLVDTIHASEDTEAHHVKGTQLTLAKINGNWGVNLGQYRLSTNLNGIKEAYLDSQRTDIDRIMQITQIQIDFSKKLEQ